MHHFRLDRGQDDAMDDTADGTTENGGAARNELGVVLMWIVLAAFTFRLGAAVAAGIVAWTREPFESFGRQVGDSLLYLGGFADGQGILLLLAGLGLFWWRRSNLTSIRQRQALLWLTTLFVVTGLGAIVVIAGEVIYYAGAGSVRLTWAHYVGTGGFELAYGLVAICGAIVTSKELHRMGGIAKEDPAPSPPPSEAVTN
jgi:hypothetical protein